MYEWQSGAHQPRGGAAGVAGGTLDAVELEDGPWTSRGVVQLLRISYLRYLLSV